MTDSLIVTIVTACSTMLTAILALLLNHPGFGILDKPVDDTNTNLGYRIDNTNRRFHATCRIDDLRDEILRRLHTIGDHLKSFSKSRLITEGASNARETKVFDKVAGVY